MGDETNQLYEACVGYMVSDQSKANSWDTVARETVRLINEHKYIDAVESAFNAVEEQVRADYGVKKLPTAWRSAKSVALAALRNSVPLLDEQQVRGKTAVEREMKAVSFVPVAPSWFEVADLVARTARTVKALSYGPNTTEKDALVTSLVNLKGAMYDKGIHFA